MRKMVEEAPPVCDSGGTSSDNGNLKKKTGFIKFKKTRRGKKKKLKSISDGGDTNGAGIRTSSSTTCDNPPDMDGFGDIIQTVTSLAAILNPVPNKQPMLRPLQVPKAPKNSTQFIIDDHQNCNLYMSFEENAVTQVVASSMGFEDIDYEYLSPDDLDMTAFYERDFEATYRKAREEKLQALDRDALLEQLADLERRQLELEAERATSVVDKLQEDLLKLQWENRRLRRTNRALVGGGGTLCEEVTL